jgi:hypothetical protein
VIKPLAIDELSKLKLIILIFKVQEITKDFNLEDFT